MASKHMGLLRAAGGQISLHSMHGRFLQKVVFLDVPHFFANGPQSSLMSIGGEVSLHGSYGRRLQRVAGLQTDTAKAVAPNEIGGEVSLHSPHGAAVGAVQF